MFKVCVITFIPSCLVKITNSVQLLLHSFIHTTTSCLFLECQEGTALQETGGKIDKRFVEKLGCYLRSDFFKAELGVEIC